MAGRLKEIYQLRYILMLVYGKISGVHISGNKETVSERLDEIMKHLKDEYEVPQSIHEENAVRFFNHVLGADKSTLELLQIGFRLDRNYLPKYYMKKNNWTAREDLDFYLKKTLEYKEKGSVEVGKKRFLLTPFPWQKSAFMKKKNKRIG